MSPALFLDRDGVINVNHGYVYERDNFDFIPGIFELIASAKARHWPVFVVTNQSGIARGMYSEDEFIALTKWMMEQIEKQNGKISKVYWCPHHPELSQLIEERNCDCRKPKIGMFLQAQQEFGIDMGNSIMIGDKRSDMQAAKDAGIQNRILFSQDPKQSSQLQTRWHNASDLLELDLSEYIR